MQLSPRDVADEGSRNRECVMSSRRAAEPEAAAAVALPLDEGRVGMSEETFFPIGDERELLQLEFVEDRTDSLEGVHAMGVEDDSRRPDRDDEHECAARRKDPLELRHRLEVSVGIEGISVAAETDMLDDVHTGERLDAGIPKRKSDQIRSTGANIVQEQISGSVLLELHFDERGDHGGEVDGGGDVHVSPRAHDLRDPRRPGEVVDVVPVER